MLFKKKYKYIEMTHKVRDYEDFSVSLPTGDDHEYLRALIRTLHFEKRTVHLLRINVLIRRSSIKSEGNYTKNEDTIQSYPIQTCARFIIYCFCSCCFCIGYVYLIEHLFLLILLKS
jgi:hypothetical protein